MTCIRSVFRLIFSCGDPDVPAPFVEDKKFNFTHVLCQRWQVSKCCSAALGLLILGPSLAEGKDYRKEKLIGREAQDVLLLKSSSLSFFSHSTRSHQA